MVAAVHHVTATTQFWPATLGAWAAIAAALISSFAGVMSVRNHNRIQVVHTLVNNQRDELETKLGEMTEKRDELITEREAAHESTGNVRPGTPGTDPRTGSQS